MQLYSVASQSGLPVRPEEGAWLPRSAGRRLGPRSLARSVGSCAATGRINATGRLNSASSTRDGVSLLLEKSHNSRKSWDRMTGRRGKRRRPAHDTPLFLESVVLQVETLAHIRVIRVVLAPPNKVEVIAA